MDPLITTETLVGSVRRLWVPAQHYLLKYDSVGLKEVAQAPYIKVTVVEAAQSALKYRSKTPYQPNVILRTSSVEAVRSMVANNQGGSVRHATQAMVA